MITLRCGLLQLMAIVSGVDIVVQYVAKIRFGNLWKKYVCSFFCYTNLLLINIMNTNHEC